MLSLKSKDFALIVGFQIVFKFIFLYRTTVMPTVRAGRPWQRQALGSREDIRCIQGHLPQQHNRQDKVPRSHRHGGSILWPIFFSQVWSQGWCDICKSYGCLVTDSVSERPCKCNLYVCTFAELVINNTSIVLEIIFHNYIDWTPIFSTCIVLEKGYELKFITTYTECFIWWFMLPYTIFPPHTQGVYKPMTSADTPYKRVVEQHGIVLDQHMHHVLKEAPIFVRPHGKRALMEVVDRDAAFLRDNRRIDYSLLIGLDDNKWGVIIVMLLWRTHDLHLLCWHFWRIEFTVNVI